MNLLRFFNTVKNFQPDQVRQKVVYEMLRKQAGRKRYRIPGKTFAEYSPVTFGHDIHLPKSWSQDNFYFSRRRKSYVSGPDWNDRQFGALWNIRLNSFDYLLQSDMDESTGYFLMRNFSENARVSVSCYDSYCVSQRLLNWIPFISKHSIKDESLLEFLYGQAHYLSTNPEYHLRNNHLLDNGFALIRAGIFFGESFLFEKGADILREQLPVQILNDGGHVERCPMYHCVVLWRLLETIELLKSAGDQSEPGFLNLLEEKAGTMCSWLMNIAFDSGELPNVNDSADYMPSWPALIQYAHSLGVRFRLRTLGASSFRKFRNRHFEMLVDMQGISSAPTAGHSHAAAMHFILHVFGSPFIIDTGVSTYESGKERMYERSTRAHNTVVVGGKNQSEVYGNFRVGKKALVSNLNESRHGISAIHNGFLNQGILHHRSFDFQDKQVVIRDRLDGYQKQGAAAFFHVHKKCGLRLDGNRLISKFVTISFEGADQIRLANIWHSPAFGVKLPAWEVRVDFSGSLQTTIALA